MRVRCANPAGWQADTGGTRGWCVRPSQAILAESRRLIGGDIEPPAHNRAAIAGTAVTRDDAPAGNSPRPAALNQRGTGYGRWIVTRKRTILIVDDDVDVREYFAAVLEADGFDVVPAEDGETALRLVEEKAPIDLLLTDIRMPKLDGIELARRIAAARPALRVLFVSGYPGPGVGEIEKTLLIQKPVRPDELVRHVRRVLRTRRAPPD
jgi:CheY-like chemotaxis protein